MSEKEEKETNQAEEEEEESEEGEESEEEIKANTLEIKQEKLNTITLDVKTYDKLLSFLRNYNELTKKIKVETKKKGEEKEVQTDEKIKPKEKEAHQPSSETSQMITALQEQVKSLTEANSKLITQNNELAQQLASSSAHSSKIIDDLNKEIAELKEKIEKQLTRINILNEKVELKKQNNTFDLIKSNPKLVVTITKYLQKDEKVSLARSSHYLWQEIFYRTKSEVTERKLIEKDSLLSYITKEDVTQRFDVTEEQLKEILTTYITKDKISGMDLRNQIVQSLIFLHKDVKTPLKNFKGPDAEIQTNSSVSTEDPNSATAKMKNLLHIRPGGKREKMLNKFTNVISMIKGDEDLDSEGNPITNYAMTNRSVLRFTKDDFNDLFSTDRHILEVLNNDKTVNVQFDFGNANDIKELISEFFKSQLPKTTYQTFLSKICETFADLLYSCYVALKDIKELEIIKAALYCRYMKYKERSAELEIELRDMNKFAKSSKEVKEMLLKQKNEVEMKYNNSMMMIADLNNEKAEKDKEVNELKEKMDKKAADYEKFKSQIIKEYKNIQKDYSLTKKERDLFKNTLVDFKNYFMKFIRDDGELIE